MAGRDQDALGDTEGVLDWDSNDLLALRTKAMALDALQRHEEAVEAQQLASKLNPSCKATRFELAVYHINAANAAQDYPRAYKWAEEALELQPHVPHQMEPELQPLLMRYAFLLCYALLMRFILLG